jgi:hypothetical protein
MRWLIAVPLCLAACTSATTPGPVPSGPTSVIATGSHGMHVSMGSTGGMTAHTVGGTADAVWSALPAVYEELQIPVRTMERDAYRLGNRELQVSRRLAGVALAQYIDCGLGAGSTPLANTSRVTLSILTRLQQVGDSTQVLSELTGTGRPFDATGGDRVRCTTTGRLEARIVSLLRTRLAAQADG